MKKTRLFGMLALAVALVFGAASCKQDTNTWDDLKDVLEADEDLSGTWKLTDYSGYAKFDGEKESMGDVEYTEIPLLTKQLAKDFFYEMLTTYETMYKMYGGGGEFSATINGKRDEIQFYLYCKTSEDGHDFELEMEFTVEKL